jgi:hypothetical protein
VSSNNLPARRSSLFGSLSTDRATGKQLATIQTGAFMERAQDEALRNLVMAKMSDFSMATRHGMDEAEAIIRDLARRMQNSDGFGDQILVGLSEEGALALKRELRRLSGGGF